MLFETLRIVLNCYFSFRCCFGGHSDKSPCGHNRPNALVIAQNTRNLASLVLLV